MTDPVKRTMLECAAIQLYGGSLRLYGAAFSTGDGALLLGGGTPIDVLPGKSLVLTLRYKGPGEAAYMTLEVVDALLP